MGDKGGFGAGRGRGIVFLAWGAWAINCVSKLDKVSAFEQSTTDSQLNLPRMVVCALCNTEKASYLD